jgi:hypothetical protein
MDPNHVLVAHPIMAQRSVTAGMNHFEERGEDAAAK